MQQKHFYKAFSILYSAVKDGLRISQKEELYRLLFRDAYFLADDDLFGNDQIRKVTAGSSPIHRKATKALYSEYGFETLRANIERICLPQLSDSEKILTDMLSVVSEDTWVPEPVKQMLSESIQADSSYHLSKAAAGILLCLDRSDYLCRKGISSFGDVGFMRLSSDKPIPAFPRYLSDPPNAAVDMLIGREEDLRGLYDEIICGTGKMMVSAVGGLGKTELTKAYQALGLFGPEQCIEGSNREDYTGKVLVVSPNSLKESCWSLRNQLWLAESGFGCSPTSLGRAVYGTCLGDGERARWDRGCFIGIVKEELLPDWAQEKLQELRNPRQEQASGPAMDSIR